MDNEFLRDLADQPKDFLAGFSLEPPYEGTLSVAPPPVPTVKTVMHDGIDNYTTLANGNNVRDYGMTGLMAVQPWHSPHYGPVEPGTIFLFPGTYEDNPLPYEGVVHLNGAAHPPLLGTNSGTLHRQMCNLLGQPPADFIGFAVKYPARAPDHIRYNSATCNVFWFGSVSLPQQWQALVYSTLDAHLPALVPVDPGHPAQICTHRRSCRICGDLAEGYPATWYRSDGGKVAVGVANS